MNAIIVVLAMLSQIPGPIQEPKIDAQTIYNIKWGACFVGCSNDGPACITGIERIAHFEWGTPERYAQALQALLSICSEGKEVPEDLNQEDAFADELAVCYAEASTLMGKFRKFCEKENVKPCMEDAAAIIAMRAKEWATYAASRAKDTSSVKDYSSAAAYRAYVLRVYGPADPFFHPEDF